MRRHQVRAMATELISPSHGSGAPSYPPVMGDAQQFLSNPMVTQAAMHYGQEVATHGRAYMEAHVRAVTPSLCLLKLHPEHTHAHT